MTSLDPRSPLRPIRAGTLCVGSSTLESPLVHPDVSEAPLCPDDSGECRGTVRKRGTSKIASLSQPGGVRLTKIWESGVGGCSPVKIEAGDAECRCHSDESLSCSTWRSACSVVESGCEIVGAPRSRGPSMIEAWIPGEGI